METNKVKAVRRARRKRTIRRRLSGTAERPRLTVFRSNKHIYCQVIDDDAGRTLAAASTGEASLREAVGTDGGNKKGAIAIGKAIADRAKAAGVKRVCFDRNGYKFHGRIQALAASAREHGLEF
ncbi:MAG: 50S ribosomal protein L18 [Planctomycetes bacterium]|nr:50S ribosomal protein L18 [Planctomycetota bacterium]